MNEKWEYKIEYFDITDIDEGTRYLNCNGEAGWELVQFYKGCSIFKRKIQQANGNVGI